MSWGCFFSVLRVNAGVIFVRNDEQIGKPWRFFTHDEQASNWLWGWVLTSCLFVVFDMSFFRPLQHYILLMLQKPSILVDVGTLFHPIIAYKFSVTFLRSELLNFRGCIMKSNAQKSFAHILDLPTPYLYVFLFGKIHDQPTNQPTRFIPFPHFPTLGCQGMATLNACEQIKTRLQFEAQIWSLGSFLPFNQWSNRCFWIQVFQKRDVHVYQLEQDIVDWWARHIVKN